MTHLEIHNDRLLNPRVSVLLSASTSRLPSISRLEGGTVSVNESKPVAKQSISVAWPTGPAKWKLAVLACVGLYPTVTLASWAAAQTVPHWVLPARTLVVIVMVVPTMTYAVTPALHRRLGGWLNSNGKHREIQ
jgi:antibiotic biosynthesis monooxygenase (ABM) superfamily enzyme